jgi:hypothetical protein
MAFNDQRAAQLLAVCNDIGEAAYLDSQIAVGLLDIFRRLPSKDSTLPQLAARYGFNFGPAVTGAASNFLSPPCALSQSSYQDPSPFRDSDT